jgi:hypothetical protein
MSIQSRVSCWSVFWNNLHFWANWALFGMVNVLGFIDPIPERIELMSISDSVDFRDGFLHHCLLIFAQVFLGKFRFVWSFPLCCNYALMRLDLPASFVSLLGKMLFSASRGLIPKKL